MRTVAAFLLAAFALAAQQIATDSTGSTLYWATTLRPVESNDTGYNRILRWRSGEFAVAVNGLAGRNSVTDPVVGEDGELTGYMLTRPCLTGSCGLGPVPLSYYSLPSFIGSVFPPSVFRSMNGRFLVVNGSRLADLRTRAVTELPGSAVAVADNGATLIAGATRELSLWKDGQRLPFQAQIPDLISATLTAYASHIVYSQLDRETSRVRIRVTASSSFDPRTIYDEEWTSPFPPAGRLALTPDGTSAIWFLGSVKVIAVATGDVSTIVESARGISLSGDGRQLLDPQSNGRTLPCCTVRWDRKTDYCPGSQPL